MSTEEIPAMPQVERKHTLTHKIKQRILGLGATIRPTSARRLAKATMWQHSKDTVNRRNLFKGTLLRTLWVTKSRAARPSVDIDTMIST
jgi:hypothetical protein